MPDGDAARLSWRKIVAEGLSIVVSILLAFAIDAWWDSRKDLGEEREHLNALKLEFRQDREVVAREILVLEDAAAATKTLLALDATEASQIDADSLASLFDRSVRAGASAPIAAGAVQSLLSSGDLGLIRDKELASRIAAWPSQLADVAVNQQLLVRNREEALLPFVDQFMGELWIARRSRWLEGYPESRFPIRTKAMFTSPLLEGHLTSRAVRLEFTAYRYRELRAAADSIQKLIDSELER